MKLVGYTDSDWAGCEDTRKSNSGYIFILAEGVASWKSMKKSIVASLTTEAEYIGCFKTSWLKNFVTDLKVVDFVSRSLLIYYNNTFVVAFSINTSSESRSRHIDIKFLRAKDRVRDQLVTFEHIRTESMMADPLTKALHAKYMGLIKE